MIEMILKIQYIDYFTILEKKEILLLLLPTIGDKSDVYHAT